jgi:hypothetical protein
MCIAALEIEDVLLISAGTLAEALIVSNRRNVGEAMATLLHGLGFEVVPVTQTSARRVAEGVGATSYFRCEPHQHDQRRDRTALISPRPLSPAPAIYATHRPLPGRVPAARKGDERIRIAAGARGSQNKVPLIGLRLRTLYRMINRTINPESRSRT